MDVTLTDDQALLRDTTVRFLTTECGIAEVRRLVGTEDGFVPDLWRRGADLGWTSLLVPESLGGGSVSGSGVVDLSIVADAFGRHVAPGPLGPTNIVASALARSGSDHRALLQRILTGEGVAAWCGSTHAWGTGAVSAAEGRDGYVVTGWSAPVEAAAQSEALLVTAAVDGEPVQVVVPATTPGVTITPLRSLDPVRRFARVDLDGVSVPQDALVEPPGSGRDEVEHLRQCALVVQSAQMVGAAERSFDLTVEWAFDRYSFGRPLASYQELKHRFADMKMWLEASHALAAALAREVQAGDRRARETASETKAYLGTYLADLMQDCVQMHGGIGLTTDHDLHLYLRRVVADRALFGTPAVHRQRLARLALEDEADEEPAA